MRYRTLGRGGPRVSEVGFGAWAIGGAMWGGGARDDEVERACARAIELGVTLFDSALIYGDGRSEAWVGRMARRHPGQLVVTTKVPPKLKRFPPPPGVSLHDYYPAEWIVASCERSLANLGLERIDVLQLHTWSDAWTDEDEWYEAMLRLRQAGKIARIGASINSHAPDTALGLVTRGRVDVLQVAYNLFNQGAADALLPACLAHGVGVLARVPLDEGSLTGKLRADSRFGVDDFRHLYFGGELLAETVARVEALRPLVEAEAASLARGALRFCLSHPAVSCVIPGIRTPAQADENCAASDDGPLPPALMAALAAHRWLRSATLAQALHAFEAAQAAGG